MKESYVHRSYGETVCYDAKTGIRVRVPHKLARLINRELKALVRKARRQ